MKPAGWDVNKNISAAIQEPPEEAKGRGGGDKAGAGFPEDEGKCYKAKNLRIKRWEEPPSQLQYGEGGGGGKA